MPPPSFKFLCTMSGNYERPYKNQHPCTYIFTILKTTITTEQVYIRESKGQNGQFSRPFSRFTFFLHVAVLSVDDRCRGTLSVFSFRICYKNLSMYIYIYRNKKKRSGVCAGKRVVICMYMELLLESSVPFAQ